MMNNSSEVSDCHEIHARLNVGLGIVMLILGSISIFGNSLVCIVIVTNKGFRALKYRLLLALAIADLFLSVTLLPYDAIGIIIYHKEKYIYPAVWVAFGNAFWSSAQSLSILSLLLVSIERFIAIRFPIKHVRIAQKKYAYFGVVFVWVYSVITFLVMFFLQIRPDEGEYDYLVPTWLEWFVLTMNIYLPSALNIIIYVFIVKRVLSLHQKRKTKFNVEMNTQRNSKSIKLLSYVMLSFMIFWLPFLIFQIYLETKPSYMYTCTGDFIDTFVGAFTFCNTVTNFLIYGAFNKKFKAAYKKLFTCKQCINTWLSWKIYFIFGRCWCQGGFIVLFFNL